MSTGSISKLANNKNAQDAPEAKEAIIEEPLDIGTQLPSFADLLPEQLLPYWQFIE